MKNCFLIVILSLFVSCNKNKGIRSEKGGIDVVTNIYYNASKGLDDHQQIIISKINYWNNDIIELVPNIHLPEITDSIYYIRDSVYFDVGNKMAKSLFSKKNNFLTSRKAYSIKNLVLFG